MSSLKRQHSTDSAEEQPNTTKIRKIDNELYELSEVLNKTREKRSKRLGTDLKIDCDY